jgi:hypothetical protein
VDRLDPFLVEEWNGFTKTQLLYVHELLRLADYKEPLTIARRLVTQFPSHSYVINEETARNLGLRVANASKYQNTWNLMRRWLAKYMLRPTPTHYIRYALPEQPGVPTGPGDSNENGSDGAKEEGAGKS